MSAGRPLAVASILGVLGCELSARSRRLPGAGARATPWPVLAERGMPAGEGAPLDGVDNGPTVRPQLASSTEELTDWAAFGDLALARSLGWLAPSPSPSPGLAGFIGSGTPTALPALRVEALRADFGVAFTDGAPLFGVCETASDVRSASSLPSADRAAASSEVTVNLLALESRRFVFVRRNVLPRLLGDFGDAHDDIEASLSIPLTNSESVPSL